jgi:hypothetical protein
MARISTYGLDTSISREDLLIGTDAEDNKMTKNYSVGSIADFMVKNDSNLLMLDQVKMRCEWSNRVPGQFVTSTLFTDLKYPLLKVDFENLKLDAGSTYNLIIERFKRQKATNERKVDSGYKRQESAGSNPPYNGRVIEIPITATSGQLFDFKLDLYYPCAGTLAQNNEAFPQVAGSRNYTTPFWASKQYVAFRISKTTDGVTKTSPVLQELILKGTAVAESGGTVVTHRRITFIPK